MADYVFFLLENGDKVLGRQKHQCADDAEAKLIAHTLAEAAKVEVWRDEWRICTVKKWESNAEPTT
jgi:hypothetical protein